MINKEDYVKCVESIGKFLRSDSELYDKTGGIFESERWEELWDMVNTFSNTLMSLTNDKNDLLFTYLYERDIDDISMASAEEFYDNYISRKAMLVDILRKYDDEELGEFLLSVYKTGMVAGKVMKKTNLTKEDMLEWLHTEKE